MPEKVGQAIERLHQAEKLSAVKRLADELGRQLSQLLQQRDPETSEQMQQRLRMPRKPAQPDVESVRYGVFLGITAVANHIVDSRRNMREILRLLAEDLARKDASSEPDGLTIQELADLLGPSPEDIASLVDILLRREYVTRHPLEEGGVVLTADGMLKAGMEDDDPSPKQVGDRREIV